MPYETDLEVVDKFGSVVGNASAKLMPTITQLMARSSA